jgi:hypothetical protein
MLLHVIEAAAPVELTYCLGACDRLSQQMRNALAFVHHIGNLDAVQPAGIAWLAPRGWVESRAIEVHSTTIIGQLDDGRFEIAEVRVGVVEALSQFRACPSR